MATPSILVAPDELGDVQSVAFIVLDSLRWDSFLQAQTPVLDRLAARQSKRYSYASWTQPSHTCLLAGLLPHESLTGTLASATYATDYSLWAHVLGGSEEAKQHLQAEFCLPLMAQRCGWHTIGRVAMPVLNENTQFSRGFNDYSLSPAGSNLGTQIESVSLSLSSGKNFVFINAGDTHYPYLLPKGELPHLSGAHGVLDWEGGLEAHPDGQVVPFTREEMQALHRSQIRATELADKRIGYLAELLPKPLLLLVVSDHGELFGEAGFFGHGPFFHPALFEVPMAAGIIR